MDIVVVGSNNVDLITYIDRMPVEGETIEAPDFAIGCGGKGSNQAVAAARLGSDVLMLTCVGDDAFAQMTLNNYRNNGISTEYVKQVPGTSGVAPIFVDPQSRNSIIIVKGANRGLKPEDVEAAEHVIANCKLMVVQLEIDIATTHAAIDVAHRNGVPILLNPAPAGDELDPRRVELCDFVVPNETELATLTGMPVDTDEQVREAAWSLLERGCKHVIVTMGSRGVMLLSADSHSAGDDAGKAAENAGVFIESVKVDPVDTTGAGDAFIGCFAHCFARGLSLVESLQTSNAYAALSVMNRGTQLSYPTAETFAAWREQL